MSTQIIITGEKKNIGDYMSAMDLFLFPPFWKGLGIVSIEAQANGLPVLASDCIPEEALITDTITTLPLKAGHLSWAEFILNNINKFQRRDNVNEIIDAGYDIQSEANKLQNRYLELIGE